METGAVASNSIPAADTQSGFLMLNMSKVKLEVSHLIVIITIIFTAGGFYLTQKNDIAELHKQQDDLKSSAAEYRKYVETTLESMRVNQEATRLMMQELKDRLQYEKK